jgi:hypothetical protein
MYVLCVYIQWTDSKKHGTPSFDVLVGVFWPAEN